MYTRLPGGEQPVAGSVAAVSGGGASASVDARLARLERTLRDATPGGSERRSRSATHTRPLSGGAAAPPARLNLKPPHIKAPALIPAQKPVQLRQRDKVRTQCKSCGFVSSMC